MNRPLAIAHRGASARETENSIAAFRAAASLGADAVELDVHATADGALVVHHDESVGHHHIAHVALAEVRAHLLANGECVPILEEALAAIVPEMIAFVEVKGLGEKWDGRLFDAIDGCPRPDRVRLHSFEHRIVRRLGNARPSISRGVLSSSYPIHPTRMMEDADAQALWQEASLIDEELIRKVHAAEGDVYAWTVDDPNRMRHLLALGVDGICTNHPDRARAEIDSRNS